MKQKLSIVFTAVIATVLLILVPSNVTEVSANSVNVTILEAGSNNVSIADGYFSNTAQYTVENGKNYVQLTLSGAQYVKSLSGPYGAAQVISETGDNRVIEIQVGDPNQPVNLNMHIVVPEELAGMPYDNSHSARMVLKGVPSAPTSNDSSPSEQAAGGTVENPPTSDNTPIGMYVTLVLASIAVFTVYRLRVAKTV